MRRRSSWIMLGCLLMSGCFAAGPLTKDDNARLERKQLQGRWEVLTVECDGASMAGLYGGAIYHFTGEQVRLKMGSRTTSGSYALDPTQEPKTINLTLQSADGAAPVVQQGIYEVQGDYLRLCFGSVPLAPDPSATRETARPQTFASKGGCMLWILHRK